MTRRRLDAELVRRQLARSRDHARELIEAGAVRVRGTVAGKAATQVEDSEAIVVDESAADHYVSRGAHKLLGALAAFPDIVVQGQSCLDAGASTGGFTQVLLERGAARVLAVDVGYGQLAWSLRTVSWWWSGQTSGPSPPTRSSFVPRSWSPTSPSSH